jgi:hypothetical protein
MKIRFHKNHLRLRLSQSEVAQLAGGAAVRETFEFPNASLSFSLVQGGIGAARLEGNEISILARRDDIADWVGSDREGIEFQDGSMTIAVEKDYQCLHKTASDEMDVFPNPMADRL